MTKRDTIFSHSFFSAHYVGKYCCMISILLVVFSACTKEKKYQYEVDPVTVAHDGGSKNNQKSTSEFISIAYADLYGSAIPQIKLINLSTAYAAFGDQKLIEDRIIRNFLNDTLVVIPTQPAVNGDTVQFIKQSYRKFFNRDPNEYEKYFWKNFVRNNAVASPTMIWYSLMTSDEYRFY